MSADTFPADHDAGVPVEVRLEQFITGEDSESFWLPKAETFEQSQADAVLAKAVRQYERAYGLDATTQQLAFLIALARSLSRKNEATRRVLAARADINAEAAMARADGDEDRAREIEARPTPDYPEKAADEKEFGYAV